MYALRQDFTPQKECVKVLHRAQELAVEHNGFMKTSSQAGMQIQWRSDD